MSLSPLFQAAKFNLKQDKFVKHICPDGIKSKMEIFIIINWVWKSNMKYLSGMIQQLWQCWMYLDMKVEVT